MTQEPKPPRTKHGTLQALRTATLTYCETWLGWRHGAAAATWKKWCNTYSEGREDEAEAHAFEARATKIRRLFEHAEKLALDFEKDCPRGTAGPNSEIIVRAAHALKRVRRSAKAISGAEHLGLGEAPTRAAWVRDWPPWFEEQNPDDQALSVYSILSGFWPDRVNEEKTTTAAERRRGASVAEVMRAERNAIGQARKPRKTAQVQEEWLLSVLKKQP